MLSLQKFFNNVSADKARTPVRFVIGLATGLVGIADMLSAIVPKLNWDILLGAYTSDFPQGPQKLTVVVGFFLIMLSYGLMRGKKQAWAITAALLILSFFLHIKRGGSVLASIVALALLLLLLLLVRFFRARSDPPSVRRGYVALILGLGIVVFYTVNGFIILYKQFEPVVERFGIDGVLLRLITNTHLHLPHDTQAFLLERAFPLLCVSAVLFGMFSILRPVAATLLPDAEARQKVRQHTRIYGKNSISYFAFSEEKSYFFSSSGKSVISYVLEGQVAVVAGDPIGPDNEVIIAIEEFMAFCREQDWTIVLWQVRDDLALVYRSLGLHLLKIGEDAVIDTQKFTLKGGAMANVRSSAKRAEKDGVSVTFYRGTVLDYQQRMQMQHISQQWLAQKGGSEMGFSMGYFDPDGDPEQITALAVDSTNRVHAFVTFIPIYGRQGWGLDLLRRADCSAPGTIELLLARSIEYLKNNGAAMVSLGLAPLSNANNDDTTLLDTSIDFLTHRFGNLSKSQSLFNFKKKFQPTWESRYLVFSNTLTLPKIGWALYKAHQEDATFFKTLRRSVLGWQKSYETVKEKIATGALEALKV